MNNKLLHQVAMLLLWVGGLNWGLVGLLNLNLVQVIFGLGLLAQVIYILVGVSAVYLFFTHKETCKECMMMMKGKKK